MYQLHPKGGDSILAALNEDSFTAHIRTMSKGDPTPKTRQLFHKAVQLF